MRIFSQLCAPLTDLTKKGAFRWVEEAQGEFDIMKEVMSTCLMLALPDSSQPFVLEYDASREGIGVVLMQNKHPIAFESCKLRATGEASFHLRQGDVSHHACASQIHIVSGGRSLCGEDRSQQFEAFP